MREEDEERGARPVYLDVWQLVGGDSLAGALAVRIEHLARGRDGACTASNATLARECGVAERSIPRALDRLRAAGALEEEPTARTTRRRLVRPPAPPTAQSWVPMTAASGVTDPDPRPASAGPLTLERRTPDPGAQDPRPQGHPRKEERKGERKEERKDAREFAVDLTRDAETVRAALYDAHVRHRGARPGRELALGMGHSQPVVDLARWCRATASDRGVDVAAVIGPIAERWAASRDRQGNPKPLRWLVDDPAQFERGTSARPTRTGIIPVDQERSDYVFEPITTRPIVAR